MVIWDARESSEVEASWRKVDTVFEELLHTVGVVSSSTGQIWWPLKDFG